MQTFILRVICFCVFGFIFYCAVQPSIKNAAITRQNQTSQARTVLIANKIETKSFEVEMQNPTPLERVEEKSN